MLAHKAVEKVGESADGHQKVEDTMSQRVGAPSEDIRVEENTELQAQNVDKDTREVAEILVSNSFGSKNQPMEVDEEVQEEQENVGVQPDFDLNIEDTTNDFNNEIFQDAQDEHIQQDDQNVQYNTDQNVQNQNVLETMAQNVPTAPIEMLSVDPDPLAS